MVVGAFAVMVVIWVTNGLRQDKRTKDAAAAVRTTGASMRTAGLAWQSTVQGAMNRVGTTTAPLPPDLFKALNAAIDHHEEEEHGPE